ncbi:MAG: hypothetical protein HRU20_01100 [Pseudomonadales bacterium]|nr:hypothetical protein [Pseudomonadales bacterium]
MRFPVHSSHIVNIIMRLKHPAALILLTLLSGFGSVVLATARPNVEPIQPAVVEKNSAPVFKSQGALKAKEGEVLSHHLFARDADGDELHFTLVEGPDNLGISSNGLLQWMPGFNDAGSHKFSVAISDGKTTITAQGVIDVENTNRAPSLASKAELQAQENSIYTYAIIANDEDAETLTYQLTQGPKGMVLQGSELSWTPDFKQAGKHRVTVVIRDAVDEVEQSFDIKVKNTNRAPVWQPIAAAQFKEGSSFVLPLKVTDADGDQLSYSIATGPDKMSIDKKALIFWAADYDAAGVYMVELLVSDGETTVAQSFELKVIAVNRAPAFTSKPVTQVAEAAEYNYLLQSLDPDEQDVKLMLKSGPKGMVLKDGQLHWLPDYTQAGRHPVVLHISDGDLSAEQSFIITVENTNRTPQWQMTELPDGKESTAYTAILKAGDADGDALRYRLKDGPKGLQVSPSGVVEWLPGFEVAGSHQLKLIAEDGQGQTAISLGIYIENTNRPPEFSALPPLLAAENKAWSYKVVTHDADADTLITKMLKGPQGMVFKEGKLQWLPTFEQAGAHPIILETGDATLKVQQKFTLQVSNTNRKPTFIQPESAVLTLAEGQDWQIPLQLSDADGDKLELTISAAPEGVKLQANRLTWTPGFVTAGTETIRLSVSDAESVVYMTLKLAISNTNRVPKIGSAAVLTAKEDMAYEYELLASDADIVEDANSTQTLSYKILQGPEGMAFVANRLRWTPGFEHGGEHLIKVQVWDGDLSLEQAFTIDVENTNRAPLFDSDAITYILENKLFEYDVEAVDQDGDAVQLTLEKAPEGMRLDDNLLTWRPGFFEAGEYPVILKASDGKLATMQKFVLMVDNNNRLPVFTSKPKKVAHENVAYTYQISVTDEDKEKLGLMMLSAPEGMTMAGNGLIKWRPAFHQKGEHAVQISVSDGNDMVQQSFMVKVVDTNREPSFTQIEAQSITVDKKFRYQIQASDVDGDDLNYQLVHGPKGLEINDDGKLYWRPTESDIGSHTVIISISDGDLKVRKHFDIRVLEDVED